MPEHLRGAQGNIGFPGVPRGEEVIAGTVEPELLPLFGGVVPADAQLAVPPQIVLVQPRHTGEAFRVADHPFERQFLTGRTHVTASARALATGRVNTNSSRSVISFAR